MNPVRCCSSMALTILLWSVGSAGYAASGIDLQTLPASVQPYVQQHFPGYQIRKAAHDPMCTGGDAIDVAIRKAGQPDYSLIFTPQGEFVQLEEDIGLDKAPIKVREVVSQRYRDYQVAPQMERLTLANRQTHYLFDLSKGKVTREVIIAADGVVVCEH